MVTASEEYKADSVAVTLEWTQEGGVPYNISIISITPEVPIEYIGHTQVNLSLIYNTEYNVSVQATLTCQNQVPSHFQLFYGGFSMHDIV